jgi:hypothetical protein
MYQAAIDVRQSTSRSSGLQTEVRRNLVQLRLVQYRKPSNFQEPLR